MKVRNDLDYMMIHIYTIIFNMDVNLTGIYIIAVL